MTDWLRRAGRGRLPDGRTLLWSVAEGRRGRRWRSSTLDADGHVVLVLLLEMDVQGRFARLEVTTRSGLLTLHPEPGGSRVDGNVVHPDGVRPIAVPWGPGHVLRVADSPIPEILTRRVAVDGEAPSSILAIDASLALTALSPLGEGSGPVADPRGVPILDGAREWDLEA